MSEPENTTNELTPVIKSKAKKVSGYPIAFALVQNGKPFQYRSTKAVKVDKTHAVLIPSGKYVTIDGMKIVKVRS